ncbi:S-layer homology domain-containing protein [Rossellomorea vietnamensis]|uniref:S-layer homology domain-containing protein n=1 Tax=Rossellomorea vietnamensis TaxID=218284 RepID=A0A5D4K7W4_9BACI|nr:S-layer homology domain-containing protein [Rossellomorea vietnamensis]TYR73424.1 S-layer homology domain-containing protein [Rossellomorea vietnamensis]
MRKLTQVLVVLLLISCITVQKGKAASYQIFEDVPESNPYFEEIYGLYAKQAVKGYPSYGKILFKPKNSITRAESAKMISAVLGLEATRSTDIHFKDIKTDAWYYKAMAVLVNNGVLTGFPDGTLKPDGLLTRGQMAKILSESYGYKTTTENLAHFTDVKKDAWYAEYVGALVAEDITNGTSETTFSPDQKITRQELAALLDRAHNKVSAQDFSDGQIQNLISELQVKIDVVIQRNKIVQPSRPAFSTIREELREYSTKEMADGPLKLYYETSCTSCDHILFDIPLDYKLHFNKVEHQQNLIVVETVSASNEMTPGHFATITLVKENNQWKLANYKSESLTEHPLDISVEEAKDYLLNKFEDEGYLDVKSLEYLYYNDLDNMYVFDLVTSDSQYYNVYFNPDTGYYIYE